ncbi:four-carbon acid sugar kinase family protein [Mucilaginibacter limnophilus]|uniref:Four-carbon acid sugar kinase family protein n=1 Tax=Mucilaginibacter limnophilus TaxID=1932778 RepID=A0A3S2VAM3_9SPHI|nr:four-carbon acid sugar kinase family protein [Mucilaginibacter limnophilus]RVU02913.1 four-carbon acid sugar kinase family protein [Mucilaginibacter limnophilus]
MADKMLLSFYGDDFTGSTDVMEALTLSGIPAALFLTPPTHDELKIFRLKNTKTDIAAFGVAGVSRSMSVSEMESELPAIFEKLATIPTKYFHYKVCSTFDSSPRQGSIGRAIDIALEYFPSKWVPLLVAAPALNRFCVFGNLFARVDGQTYRLDRHPTMSVHPATPMDESDLRLHLGKQTNRPIKLVDVQTLESSKVAEIFTRQLISENNVPVVLFDALHNEHLSVCGQAIDALNSGERQLIVGSSGVEYALGDLLKSDAVSGYSIPDNIDTTEQVIVIAGSCSPGTKRQIEYAIEEGFEAIKVNTAELADALSTEKEVERVATKALYALQNNRDIILYTALGPHDDDISKTKEILDNKGISANAIGKQLGSVLKKLLNEYHSSRVVVAGGDTSGYVSRALGIYAFELLAPIAPGAPLCTAHSTINAFDGLQVALKGGQNGDDQYFIKVKNAGTSQKQVI